jgi:hypothetical protein
MGVVDIDTGRPLPPDVQSMSAYLGYVMSCMHTDLDCYFKIVIPFSLVGRFQLPRLSIKVLML